MQAKLRSDLIGYGIPTMSGPFIFLKEGEVVQSNQPDKWDNEPYNTLIHRRNGKSYRVMSIDLDFGGD